MLARRRQDIQGLGNPSRPSHNGCLAVFLDLGSWEISESQSRSHSQSFQKSLINACTLNPNQQESRR